MPPKRKRSLNEVQARRTPPNLLRVMIYEDFEKLYTPLEVDLIEHIKSVLDGDYTVDKAFNHYGKERNSRLQQSVLLLIASYFAAILTAPKATRLDVVREVVDDDLKKDMVRLPHIMSAIDDSPIEVPDYNGLIPLAAIANLLMADHAEYPIKQSLDALGKLLQLYYGQLPEYITDELNLTSVPRINADLVQKSRLRLNTLLTIDPLGKFDKKLGQASIRYFRNKHGKRDNLIIVTTPIFEERIFVNTINRYAENGKDIILWYVERVTQVPTHALLLLVNTKVKEAVLFDPLGDEAEADDDIRRLVQTIGYDYVSARRCYGNLQEDEASFAYKCTENLKTRRTEGFCFAWQLVIADVIIRTPKHSYLEVDKVLEAEAQRDPCERLDTITEMIINLAGSL